MRREISEVPDVPAFWKTSAASIFPPVIDRKGPVLKKYQFYINATVTTILLYNQKHNNEPSPISPDMNFIETMLKQDVYDHKFLWYLISGPMIALGCWYVLTSVAAMQQIPKLINIELSPSVSNIYIYIPSGYLT